MAVRGSRGELVRVKVDTKDAYAGLKELGTGLDLVLVKVFAEAGEMVAKGAGPLAPSRKKFRPHIPLAESFESDVLASPSRGVTARVFSRLPQAPVWEWGGLINPTAGAKGITASKAAVLTKKGWKATGAGHIIDIHGHHMVEGSFELNSSVIELRLNAAIDALTIAFNES